MTICFVTLVLINWSINKAAVVVEARDFLLSVSCGPWTHHDGVKDKQLRQIDGLREAWRRWWWSWEQLQTTATDVSYARSTLCMHAQWESLCLAEKKKTGEMSENGRTKEVRRMSVHARMCNTNTLMDSCFVKVSMKFHQTFFSHLTSRSYLELQQNTGAWRLPGNTLDLILMTHSSSALFFFCNTSECSVVTNDQLHVVPHVQQSHNMQTLIPPLFTGPARRLMLRFCVIFWHLGLHVAMLWSLPAFQDLYLASVFVSDAQYNRNIYFDTSPQAVRWDTGTLLSWPNAAVLCRRFCWTVCVFSGSICSTTTGCLRCSSTSSLSWIWVWRSLRSPLSFLCPRG